MDSRIRTFKFLLVLNLIILILVGSVVAKDSDGQEKQAQLQETKNVLYLSSYSPSIFTYPQQLEGIANRFEGEPIILDAEFLDSKRFHTDENYENFYNSLAYKLQNGLVYDAVIVGDDNGLLFLMENKETLFPETPIFFMGINNLETAEISSKHPQVTGVLEAKSIPETVAFAYHLNPTAKRLVALIDETPSSQAEVVEFEALEGDYPDLETTYINLGDLTFEEYFEKVKEISREDLVFVLSANKDKTGKTLTFAQLRVEYEGLIDAPRYGFTTNGIGEGVFGGKVVSHVDQGYAAADMAMDHFMGKSVEEIEFSAYSPNVYMVDYELYEKYGFDKDQLTDDIIVVNRIYTFWELYGLYIILAVVIFAIETSIIVLLFRNIQAKRLSQKALVESKTELEAVNNELLVTVDDLNLSNRELEDSISEVNERDQKIREMIYIDGLSGLMTRYAIEEVLEDLIQEKTKVAVVLMNMDNFKNVNDAFGHKFGDKVIRMIGTRLKELEEERVYISRFGGDEFLIVLKDYPDLDWVKQKIEANHKVFEAMMGIDDTKFFLTTSIGISTYPEHGKELGELIKNADVALGESKRSGKDTYTIYNDALDLDFHEKIKFQNIIRRAFNKKEFHLNYQPIVDAKLKKINGYEALIRWNSKELGRVSPFKLITEAEEMGLIVKIGEWIFEESVKFLVDLNKESGEDKYVSINVSAVQLLYTGFFTKVIEIVEKYGVDQSLICLEMTETTLIEDIEVGRSLIQQLSEYGFKIALDDFGTGYSSLSYLKNLPIDLLKIDKAFIDNITTSDYDSYLVEAVIKIAKERGIQAVAEGVEMATQFELLNKMGCPLIQGYLFSKPVDDSVAISIKNDDLSACLKGE